MTWLIWIYNEYKDRYTELISAIQDSIPGIKIVIESVLPTNPNVVGGEKIRS
mgnify:CR=1 FL=1